MPTALLTPICPACGYSLAALPKGACPECGRHFDPHDPRTLQPQTAHVYATFTLPYPALAAYGALVISTSLLLCSPTGHLSDVCDGLVAIGAFFIMVVWTIALGFHLLGRLGLLLKRYPQPRWHWRWLSVPLILFACIALVRSGLLWHLRWTIARSAFSAAAAAPPSAPQPNWLGTFSIQNIQRNSDGSIWFRIGFPDLYSDGPPYIIYCPSPPIGLRGPILQDLGGGWWVNFDNT